MLTRRLLSLTAGCALFAASGAWAQEVIWDSPVNPDLPAYIDQEFEADFSTFRTYIVQHVILERKTFIHDITTYYTNAGNLWPQGATNATLNIYPQVAGGLPGAGDDPGAGATVGANLALGANGLELTYSANGSIELAAGAYWIGLTPQIEFLLFGREFHQGSDVGLKNSAARNPGGAFGLGTDWFEAGPTFGGIDVWYGAIQITGKNIPTPGALALLGVAGLLSARHRRRQ